MTNYAEAPPAAFDRAQTVFEPPDEGEGNWVGAPSVLRHDGATLLAVRWRSSDRRGFAVAICELTARGKYVERARLTADEFGATSLERPALVTDPRTGELKLYVSVDAGDGEWAIHKLDDVTEPSAFDARTARPVIEPSAGTTDAATVKDPYVVVLGGRYYAFYAGNDGTSEQAHLATSVDGERWHPVGSNPVLTRRGWHDYHTRVSCVVPARSAPVWTVFYDGASRDDYGATWNLRTGMAVAHDLERPVDTTPNGPVLSAPVDGDGFATCRYVDVLIDGDGRELYAEVARPDGSFDLRRWRI